MIRRGIEEGRKTFANTLKYVLTTMSANLGNMLSMAVVSLFLPFLPLLAGQILLNNFISDLPAVGLANDNGTESSRSAVAERRSDDALPHGFPRVFTVRARAIAARTFGALCRSCSVRSSWFVARW